MDKINLPVARIADAHHRGPLFGRKRPRATRQALTFILARQNGEIVAVHDTVSVVFRKPAAKEW